MPRIDLSEEQIENLIRWARSLGPLEREKGEQVIAAMWELKALRDRESATRFLMGIEGDV